MKSIVVEIRSDIAAVLSDDGRIVKVKNQNYVIGQVIKMKETTKRKIHFPSAVAAAAVAVFMCGMVGVSAYAYYSPYSYVSLDVNPSIEYSLNRFDRVLKVTGVNDAGKEIIKELELDNLSNKKIDEAIALTVKQIEEDGFLDGDVQGGIVISSSAKDLKKSEALAKDLKQSAQDAAEDENIEVESFSVGFERVQEARELGVTPGKLNLVEKLRDSAEDTDDVDMDEWMSKPVKEIMQEIKENKKESKAENQTAEGIDTTEATPSGDSESKPAKTEQAATKAATKAEKAESKLVEQEQQSDNLNDPVTQDQNTNESDETKAQEKQNDNIHRQENQSQNGKSDSKS